jgi:hypothetical protein
MTNSDYNIGALRDLLEAAFTAAELRRFCEERPFLKPVLVDLPSNFSLAQVVDRVIEFCGKRGQFSELLAEIRTHNPRQYENFVDQLRITEPSSEQAERSPEEQRLGASPLSEAQGTHGESEETQSPEQPQPSDVSQPPEQAPPSDVSQPPAPVSHDLDWGKALRDWLSLIVAVVAGFFSWLFKDNLGAAGVGWVVFIVAAVSWWYSVIRRIPSSRLGFKVRSVRMPAWRAWFLLAVKGAVFLIILALAGVWGWLLWRDAQPYFAPQFEITALDTLQGDENAYELTDNLIWNQDRLDQPEEKSADQSEDESDHKFSVGITFTLQIRPTYWGRTRFGKVVALVSGAAEHLEPIELWDDFTNESSTTEIHLSLQEILQASGLEKNTDPFNTRFQVDDSPFKQSRLTVQVAPATDTKHPWASQEITLRNAPWDVHAELMYRQNGYEVDASVTNLGAPGDFSVIYDLVRMNEEIGSSTDPGASGTTPAGYWNEPKDLEPLGQGESFTATVRLPDQLATGRYLLDVYPYKKQSFVRLKDEDATWSDLESMLDLWLFAGPYERFVIVIAEPQFAMDPLIQAEWDRLRNEGVDLGIPLRVDEDVTSSTGTIGRRQVFQEGEIYVYNGQAYALYGAILEHHRNLLDQGYSLAFPKSAIQAVTSSWNTEGAWVEFEDKGWMAAIYATDKGAAAIGGWIGDRYLQNEGGPASWLGFPLAEEADYGDSTMQQFEGGYLVYYFPYVDGERYWKHLPTAYPYLTSPGRSDFGTLLHVHAEQEWQDTGIQVESRDHITIVQIAGEWSWDGTSRTMDANGDYEWAISPQAPLPSAYMGSLVGRIGQDEDQIFPVGRWREYMSPAQGNLYLRINDDKLDDNDGFITVQIMNQSAE